MEPITVQNNNGEEAMVKIAVAGAAGRMGRNLVKATPSNKEITSMIKASESPTLVLI